MTPKEQLEEKTQDPFMPTMTSIGVSMESLDPIPSSTNNSNILTRVKSFLKERLPGLVVDSCVVAFILYILHLFMPHGK